MKEQAGGGGKLILIRGYLAGMPARRAELKGRFDDSGRGASQTAATDAVLQELDTAQEELLVADEELRRQGEELERIHQGVAAELRRFRDLFDRAPDGYAETDLRGVIRLANRTLAAQLNLLPQFVEGKALINFVARADCERFRKMLLRLAERSPARTASLRLRPRHGGTPFFVDVHAVPILDPTHRVLGVRWAIRAVVDLDDDAPLSLASLAALAKAVRAGSSVPAAGKRVTLQVDVEPEQALEPELAARWFPILSATLASEVANAGEGSEVVVRARRAERGFEWQIGGASLLLPVATTAAAPHPA